MKKFLSLFLSVFVFAFSFLFFIPDIKVVSASTYGAGEMSNAFKSWYGSDWNLLQNYEVPAGGTENHNVLLTYAPPDGETSPENFGSLVDNLFYQTQAPVQGSRGFYAFIPFNTLNTSTDYYTFVLKVWLGSSTGVSGVNVTFVPFDGSLLKMGSFSWNSTVGGYTCTYMVNGPTSGYFDVTYSINATTMPIMTSVYFARGTSYITMPINANYYTVTSQAITTAYNNGYQSGFSIGYNGGLQVGNDILYNDAYNNGYNVGNDVGYNNGFSSGYNEGNSDGYNYGYNVGDGVGYQRGYNEGNSVGYQRGVEESSDFSFFALMTSVVDAPVRVFTDIIDVSILGFSLKDFILGLIGVLFAGVVIKFLVKLVV